MARTEKIEVTVLGKTGAVVTRKELEVEIIETDDGDGMIVSAPFPVDTSDWDLVDEEKMIFGLTGAEQRAADIETLKKLVLSYVSVGELYTSVYNVVTPDGAVDVIRRDEVRRFLERFEKFAEEINVTGLQPETDYDRLQMAMAIKRTLANYILPNIHPTYGAIILQPPRLEDGKLSLAYVDDFLHITFMPNLEDFRLEAINADIIQHQGEYLQKEFMTFVKEIIGKTEIPLEYLQVNLYNLIRQMDVSDISARKLFYKNTIRQIQIEWKE